MGVGVAKIQRQVSSDPFEKMLPMIGQAVGTAYGGPAGGIAGGMLGGELQTKPPEAGPSPIEASAMSRRMDQLNNDPQSQIRQSLQALNQLPPEQRGELAKPLLAADYLASNKMRG